MLNLTLDFTTDPRGNILSMTHTPSGGAQGFTGEVYFHYDNAGNTSLLTNASGVPLASFQHDALSGIAINEWNPQNIVVNIANSQGDIKIQMIDRIIITNHVIIIPGFTPIVIDAEDRTVVWDPPADERSQEYIDCICGCDPSSRADPNVDKSEQWFQETQAWFNHHFNSTCSALHDDRYGLGYPGPGDGRIGTAPNGDPIYTASSANARYESYYKGQEKWKNYDELNPWDQNDWEEWMKEIYPEEAKEGKCGKDGDGCGKGRQLAAILQTSDCMLNCCWIHVWKS